MPVHSFQEENCPQKKGFACVDLSKAARRLDHRLPKPMKSVESDVSHQACRQVSSPEADDGGPFGTQAETRTPRSCLYPPFYSTFKSNFRMGAGV
jgi:hypothetical protein